MASKKQEEFDTEEAALFLKLSPATLNRYRARGVGPEWNRRGEKLVYYTRKSLEDYEQKQRQKTKS